MNTEDIDKEVSVLRDQINDLSDKVSDLLRKKYDDLGLTERELENQKDIDRSISMTGYGVPIDQEGEKPGLFNQIFNSVPGTSRSLTIELKELSDDNFEILEFPQFDGLTVKKSRVSGYTFKNHNTGKYVMQFRRTNGDMANWAEHDILTICNEVHEMVLPHVHKNELDRDIDEEWLDTYHIIAHRLVDAYDQDPNNWRENFKKCIQNNSGEYSTRWKIGFYGKGND